MLYKINYAGRDWGQEEKGVTEDEMAGWHHRLDEREFEWTPLVGYGQEGLAYWFMGSQIVRHDWATEITSRKKTIKNTNIWKLNNTLLNNQQITEEIKKEIKICIETNENENTTTQNLWDSIKSVLRGRFVIMQPYLKKQEKNQISNLTLHLKQLEKGEMKNPRVNRRK